MKRALVAMLAAILMTFGAADAAAQSKPDDAAASFVGRWDGVKDWNGEIDTPYDGAAWWDFRADGGFVDNMGETGTWTSSGDRLIFQYGDGGQTIFSGRRFNDTVLGAMHNSDSSYTGIFSMRRQE